MARGVFAVLMILFLGTGAARAATPQEVDITVKKAVDWLYGKQKDGTWETAPKRDPARKGHEVAGGQWGGETALAIYALLAAGESPQDERLAKGIEFLKKADLVGVYAIALRAQVYSLLPATPELKGLITKDANTLRQMVKSKGDASGMFDYTNTPGNGYSHSRGNYGVLGMWALEQSGIEVPIDFWKLVEKGWIAHQDPSGGWTYQAKSKHPLTPGMTAAGVATLFITQDYVNPGRGLNCTSSPQHPGLEKGLTWLVANFGKVATDEKYDRDFPFPTLYACERVGVASGLKYFGDINWYQRGADWLIKKQSKKGSFAEHGSGDVSDTAFGVLFLSRGRSPVVINKLDYSTGQGGDAKAPWNIRPRDVARLVRWVGKSTERELQWQITNLTSSAEDLHDAPILYLSGKEEWNPSDEAKTKIKTFIDGGGLLLANADCMGKGFLASVRKLGRDMFPGYEFRELPADHPIYTEEQFLRDKWKTKPSVLGLSNGARELMLVIPQGDPAKAWQLGTVGGKEESWQLGANIILYAVDKRGLRNRGVTHLVKRDDKKKPDMVISVARLDYAGNWDPEPGGWRRMADVMHNGGVNLQVAAAKPGALGDAKVVHITGTLPLTLDAAAQVALKKAIDGGATVVVDAAGGSAEFAASAEKLIPLLATEPLKPIAPDHALYSAGGEKLAGAAYRDYAQRVVGSAKEPKLQGVERGGRFIILYSREDLSAGLVGQAVDGIIGYDPATATALMTRILHYAAGDSKTVKK